MKPVCPTRPAAARRGMAARLAASAFELFSERGFDGVSLDEIAARAGVIEVRDAEQVVNLMLASMEGIKLRALFEPEACTSEEEERIRDGLKAILGFRRAVEAN